MKSFSSSFSKIRLWPVPISQVYLFYINLSLCLICPTSCFPVGKYLNVYVYFASFNTNVLSVFKTLKYETIFVYFWSIVHFAMNRIYKIHFLFNIHAMKYLYNIQYDLFINSFTLIFLSPSRFQDIPVFLLQSIFLYYF